jgi:glycosyltransferase involved in cell wall biosynthesis
MKFLVLTKKLPYPPIDGESLLISSFFSCLKNLGHEIDLLTFNTIKHFYDPANIPADNNPYSNIYSVYLDNRLRPSDAFKNLFTSMPYHISRFISREFDETLKEILENKQYDHIIFESIFLHPYLETARKKSDAGMILRAHNVEYEIWERLTKNTNNPARKAYMTYLTGKLRSYELKNIGKYDLLCTLTQRDFEKYRENGFSGRSVVIPAGIEGKKYVAAGIMNEEILKISFIGSLDWMPNAEGIQWFIEKCWNSRDFNSDGMELHIAGRNTPKWIYKYECKNIKILGEVADSREFINSCPVMIVPLLAGSGMRLKILEALALGRVVITTDIGMEGIEAIDGSEILIANTPAEFMEKINYCKNNFSAIRQISENAVRFFVKNYELETLAGKFLDNLPEK